MTRTIVAR